MKMSCQWFFVFFFSRKCGKFESSHYGTLMFREMINYPFSRLHLQVFICSYIYWCCCFYPLSRPHQHLHLQALLHQQRLLIQIQPLHRLLHPLWAQRRVLRPQAALRPPQGPHRAQAPHQPVVRVTQGPSVLQLRCGAVVRSCTFLGTFTLLFCQPSKGSWIRYSLLIARPGDCRRKLKHFRPINSVQLTHVMCLRWAKDTNDLLVSLVWLTPYNGFLLWAYRRCSLLL